MPSSPDPRSPIFFEILCGLLLSSWPKASDEADGNTGRPQPGFFRITGKKIFELTSDGLGGELFSSDIMWWLRDWIRLILHQLPLPRKSLKGEKLFWSLWESSRHGIRDFHIFLLYPSRRLNSFTRSLKVSTLLILEGTSGKGICLLRLSMRGR